MKRKKVGTTTVSVNDFEVPFNTPVYCGDLSKLPKGTKVFLNGVEQTVFPFDAKPGDVISMSLDTICYAKPLDPK